MATQTTTIQTTETSFTAKEMRSFLRLLPDDARISQSVSEDRYSYSNVKKVTKLHATWELTP